MKHKRRDLRKIKTRLLRAKKSISSAAQLCDEERLDESAEHLRVFVRQIDVWTRENGLLHYLAEGADWPKEVQ